MLEKKQREKISKQDFMEYFKSNNLHIFFIWPSWVWKTYWSKIIKSKYKNFEKIEIDENIWKNKNMFKLLESIPWEDEAEKMWNFFWKPWEDPDRYMKMEKLYLEIEKEEMNNFYETYKDNKNEFIADFTWSCIYCHDELDKCQDIWIFIYLEASEEQYKIMQENFLNDPKPIIWWENLLSKWKEIHDKDHKNAINYLPELYKRLLDYRHRLYLQNADVVLHWEDHRDNIDLYDPDLFLEKIKSKL